MFADALQYVRSPSACVELEENLSFCDIPHKTIQIPGIYIYLATPIIYTGYVPYSGFFCSVKFSFCAKNMDFRQFCSTCRPMGMWILVGLKLLNITSGEFSRYCARTCTTPLRTRAGRAGKYSF